MLTYSNDDLEKIKHLIAEGLNEEAIDALYFIVAGDDELEDTVLMLKNRLAALQKSVREGTIEREDENVERNSINRALLDTLNILEDLHESQKNTLTEVHSKKDENPVKTSIHSVPGKPEGAKKPFFQSQLLVKSLLALATILASVFIERSLNRWLEDGATALSQNLTVRFVLRPEYYGLQQTGKAKVTIGDFSTLPQPISPDGTLHFTDIPAEYVDDSVKVFLEEVKYPGKVASQNAYSLKKSNDITVFIELKTNTYSGKVLRPNLKPAAGVEVNIENGLARDTTDAEGNFTLRVPLADGQIVQLALRRLGEAPKLSQRIGLSANVLKQLKIPD